MKSGGGIKSKAILGFINKIVIGIYKRCDKILISSKRFSESILSKGDFKDKIEYFPNWSEDMFLYENNCITQLPELPKGFRILLAGNLGKAQCIDIIMKTAISLNHIPELKWIFIGDGSMKKWLDQFIIDNSLESKVFAFGRFPAETMPYFFNKADALLLTLRSGFPHLKMVVPARLQSYMSSGKPVLGMIDGGAVDVIKESNCGITVPADDFGLLAKVIEHNILADLVEWEKKGGNGREFFKSNFTKSICMDNLERIIKDV